MFDGLINWIKEYIVEYFNKFIGYIYDKILALMATVADMLDLDWSPVQESLNQLNLIFPIDVLFADMAIVSGFSLACLGIKILITFIPGIGG